MLISTAIFMAIGGHRVVLAGLLDTFRIICLVMHGNAVEQSQLVTSGLPASAGRELRDPGIAKL